MPSTPESTKADFKVGLETEGLTANAKSAAGALEELKKSIDSDSRALAEMNKAMRNLQSGSVVNVATYRQLKEQMDLKRESIAKAQASYVGLGGSFDKTKSSGGGLESRLAAMTKNMQGMPGPIGGIVGRLGQFKGLLAGGAIALGVAAIAAAIVALTAAAVAAVVALTRYGVAQADAARSEKIRLEGLTKLRFWYQKIPGDAAAMQAGIDKVAAKSALGRNEIVKLNEQLYRLGFRGENLALTLNAAQMKMSVQGDEAAQRFIGWATAANMAGESVKKLTDRVQSDIGGLAMRQLASLDVQAKKLRESFEALFADLGIESLLVAWLQVTRLFSQTTESGKALKQLLEHLIQPVIDSVTKAAPLVKRFFQGVILAALDFEIAILDVRLMLKDTFGADAEWLEGIKTLERAVLLGKVAFYGLAGAVAVVGAMMYGAYSLMVKPFVDGFVIMTDLALEFFASWKQGADDLGITAAFNEFVASWKAGFDALLDYDYAALGTAVIDGIVGSLKAGYAIVGETIKGIADTAVKGFKVGLGIESPSKVFAKVAVEIPRGVALGVERGSPEAQGAIDNMVTPPTTDTTSGGTSGPGTSGPRSGPTGRGGASATVTIGELHVHSAAADPHSLALDVRRELESILQGLAFQLGTEPEGAA